MYVSLKEKSIDLEQVLNIKKVVETKMSEGLIVYF